MSEITDVSQTLDNVRAQLSAALTGDTAALRALLQATPADLVAAAIAALSPAEQRTLDAAIGHERFADFVALLAPDAAGQVLQNLEDAAAADVLDDITPHDAADIVEGYDAESAASVLTEMDPEDAAEIVSEIEPGEAAAVVRELETAQAAAVLEQMPPDEATDVVGELDPDEAQDILEEMAADEAADVRDLLAYPTDTAGGIMTPEFIAVLPTLTAGQAIEVLRQLALEIETIYYVYVVDEADRLRGVLSMRNLVLAAPATPLADIMTTSAVSVPVDMDQEEVAQIFNKYHFLALPVVAADNRLLGTVTFDDVARVVEQETTEDISRAAASETLDQAYLRSSVFHIVRKRFGWLLVLALLAEFYAGSVLRYFDDTLAAEVILASFIPLLIGMGGNAGSQTVATLIRAMVVEGVQLQQVLQVLTKELLVALVMGSLLALAVYLRTLTLGVPISIGLTVGLTAAAIVLWAVFAAAILPLVLHRVGIDPAVVSLPLITTIVDGTGLVIYFLLARFLLSLP